MYSLCEYNNVVPFDLLKSETMPKHENFSIYFVQNCLKIFLLLLTFLEMHVNSTNDQLLLEKSKSF